MRGLLIERVMCCPLCASANQAEFSTELAFHFSGFAHLDKPHVFVFVKTLVCLDCGFSRFTTPETELEALRKGTAPSTVSLPDGPSGRMRSVG